MTYTPRQAAATGFAFGLLFGLIFGVASCSPPDTHEPYSHTTQDGYHQ